MPTLPSPHKQTPTSIGKVPRRSMSPLPPPPPPKAIDLNSSTRSTDKETGAKITRRAFLCDLIVEEQGEGEPIRNCSTVVDAHQQCQRLSTYYRAWASLLHLHPSQQDHQAEPILLPEDPLIPATMGRLQLGRKRSKGRWRLDCQG